MSDVSSLQPGWERRRVKQLAKRFYSGGTPDSGNQSFYSQDGTGTPWLMISDMSQVKYVLSTRKRITSSGKASRRLEVLPQGTVLYAMYASVGAVSMLGIDATVNQAILGIETRRDIALPQFLAYALEDRRRDVLQVASTSTQANLSAQKVKDLEVMLPPLEEQGLIVRYLDHAELRIAKAIAAKQALMNRLLELRHVQIAEGILGTDGTRLLNSSLPYNVPGSWRVEPFWSVAPEVSISDQQGKELLSVYLNRGVIRYSESAGQVHKPSLDLSGYQLVRPGDLVLNNQQAWRGSVGVSRYEGIVSPAYVVCSLGDRFDLEYANMLFRSPAMVSQFEMASRGVGSIQRQLHRQTLRVTKVPIPPLEEQVQIATRLVAATKGLDLAIRSLEAEIALLKEYRTRLISDVVTGKLDVRDEAAKLPEIDPMELATVSVSENGDDEEATDDD